MSGALGPGKQCGWCQGVSGPQATICWICRSPLPEQAAPVTPSSTGTEGLASAFGWLAGIFSLGIVTFLVGWELLSHWPGMLIPYGGAVLAAFSGLTLTAYLHLRSARTVDGEATAGEAVLAGAGLAVAAIFVVLALLMLLGVAAFVVFFLICLAVLGSGGFH